MGFIEDQVEYHPHQIVFLECEDQRLYAEVIQTVPDRGLCWARPLALLDQNVSRQTPGCWDIVDLVDLRQSSDLLLPLSWFQAAVDVEVVPVLAQLIELKPDPAIVSVEVSTLHRSSQEQFQQFIRRLCQTHRSSGQ